MNSYQKKTLDDKNQAAANQKSISNTTMQLKDNRPQSVLQKKINESSDSFNKLPVQRVVTPTRSGKNWRSSELGEQLFSTQEAAEAAEAKAISSRTPIGYNDDHEAFRTTTKPLARAVRDAAFEAHVKKEGTEDGFVEPDLTIAGSSITGKRGAVGKNRPARDFGPRKPGEDPKEGSDYDWNVGHEALAASTMGYWPEGGEKPNIVHTNDEGSVATSLSNIGGMKGVPHNVMYSRGRDAVERNSNRKHARRDHTPIGERTKAEKDKRKAIVKKEKDAREAKAKREQEQAKREEQLRIQKEEFKVQNEIAAKKGENPWKMAGGKKRR